MTAALQFLRRSWDTVTLSIAVLSCLLASMALSRTAAWIPRIVLGITLVLLAAQLVREARELLVIRRTQGRRGTQPASLQRDTAAAATRASSPAAAVLWVCALLPSVVLLGAATGSALYSFAYLRWHAGAAKSSSAAFALVLGLCLQLAFTGILHVELYRGWLWTTLR